MRIEVVKPSGILSEYINYYWSLEAEPWEEPTCERVTPTGAVQLIFHYSSSFRVEHSDGVQKNQPQSLVSGLCSTYSNVWTQGKAGMIAVSFLPSGANHFFPFPLSEIENANVSLNCIYGDAFKRTEERIALASNLKERIQIVEEYLYGEYRIPKQSDYGLIKQGIDHIHSRQGVLTTEALASHLCITTKSLERKFASLVGKSPKQYIRIARFNSIRKHYSAKESNLTQLAHSFGYFDQAHFIKDFKSLSGLTPKEFFRLCKDPE